MVDGIRHTGKVFCPPRAYSVPPLGPVYRTPSAPVPILPKPSRDVILGFLSGRSLEDGPGVVELHQLAEQEKPREVRHTGGLLHVVRHDDAGAALFERKEQFLDL